MFLSDFKTKYGISIYILIKSPPVSDFILTILLGATLIDADRQIDRQAGRQAGRQTGRQTDRQTDRQTWRKNWRFVTLRRRQKYFEHVNKIFE